MGVGVFVPSQPITSELFSLSQQNLTGLTNLILLYTQYGKETSQCLPLSRLSQDDQIKALISSPLQLIVSLVHAVV